MDFSVCVVAPPGERSVGAGRGEAVWRESERALRGRGGCSRANIERDFPRASVADIAFGACLACGSYGVWFFVPSTWEAINVVDGAPHKPRG